MRKLFGIVVVGFLIAASVVVPAPRQPVPEAPDASAAAPFTVCPLGQAARRSTTLSVVGAPGESHVSVFSTGEIVAERDVAIRDHGAAQVELEDLTGLASAPVLIALPDAGAAVDTLLVGGGAAVSGCRRGSPETVLFPGGTTVEGESLSIVLANPFSGAATVDVAVASEVGAEADAGLEGIVVPSRSAVTIDLAARLPGRQSMSVAVTSSEGRVVASMLQEGGGDVAAWNGTVPGTDSYLPIPVVAGSRAALVLGTSGTADVAFQLDVYDADGVFEAAVEDVIPARGQIAIALRTVLEGPGAVRVVAAAPMSAVVRHRGEGIRAVVPGLPEPSAAWLLPGAGLLGPTSVHVLNPGDVEVRAAITTGDGSVVDSAVFPAATMTSLDLPGSGTGYRIEGDGDLVVSWTTVTDQGLAGDPGRPIGP